MRIFNITISIILITAFIGCKEFDDYQVNPNQTTVGDPGLLLTNIEVSAFYSSVSLSSALASRYMVYTDGTSSEQYYNWTRAGFGNYSLLRQVTKMEEEAVKKGNENYLALAKFFKAFTFFSLTNTFGDIPYTEALMATEEIDFPKYDTQQVVFQGILNELDEANILLSDSNGIISGDQVYGGDIQLWKKAINSFTLRVLISLSKKDGGSINVSGKFQNIINNPSTYPIFESNADNLALPFYNIDGNEYPYFNNNSIKTAYYLDESFVNLLKDLEDPRLFVYADKENNGANLADDDFDAYGGLDGSATLADNTERLSQGEGSPIDSRFHSDPENEPGLVIGYAETQFNIAEAVARGWISGNVSEYYTKGIEASFQFANISSSSKDYLQKPQVQYVPQNGIEMIVTQKYIASFMNSGWEAFYNNRRTNFPELKTDGGGVFNDEMVPKRWMYPQREIDYNLENLTEAINRQYPEGDNINGAMWIIK